jgi:catechol 2,3-dioxygenase-like lactoylglutathione lyase family enzyme
VVLSFSSRNKNNDVPNIPLVEWVAPTRTHNKRRYFLHLEDFEGGHMIQAKYVHTNIMAHDWQKLSKFYQDVFGCVPVPPMRDFSGEALERATNIPNAAFQGMHLRLPGFGDNGPTLEIFQYTTMPERLETLVNRPGFGHIAFLVDDVAKARKAVLEAGGEDVGETITLQTADGRKVTFVYVTDPEGNILELQSWE